MILGLLKTYTRLFKIALNGTCQVTENKILKIDLLTNRRHCCEGEEYGVVEVPPVADRVCQVVLHSELLLHFVIEVREIGATNFRWV
jgi:hypothetical protein